MAHNIKLKIDAFTCKAYGVLPQELVDQLQKLPIFSGAQMLVDYSNATLAGDYSRGGAIMDIAYEGSPVDSEELFAAAREIFHGLKKQE
jgi:hypothetical protein